MKPRMRLARASIALLALALLLLTPLTTSSDVAATVSAAGRGGPWINFRDGVPVVVDGGQADVLGPATQGRPLGLATGDFDGDGMPDLVSTYGAAASGVVVVHRGNVNAVYPRTGEARRPSARVGFIDRPFLTSRSVLVPVSPDFVGAGDFDADGHLDVVIAQRGGRALFWLPGDGRGGFGQAQRVDLPGAITALATGEVNVRDGLTDVVVGIAGDKGPQVLVFESPEGAFQSVPEMLPLPAPATALALGHVQASAFGDLIVGAGRTLIVVDGRDRRLGIDVGDEIIAEPAMTLRRLSATITALALGDFADDQRTSIAVLLGNGSVQVLGRPEGGRAPVAAWPAPAQARGPQGTAAPGTRMVAAKVSSRPGHDLILADPRASRIEILVPGVVAAGATLAVRGAPVAVLAMHLNADAQADLVVLAEGQTAPSVVLSAPVNVFTVTNGNDSGDGSLRQAILDANASPGADLIDFDFVQIITPTSPLPRITETVTIDGTTGSVFEMVRLTGASAGSATGLRLGGGGNLVRGLMITNFTLDAIQLGSGNNVIEGNLIGNDGTSGANNSGSGVRISGVTGNRIGGTTVAARNVISGNSRGVFITGRLTSGNIVLGNYIGTNSAGAAGIGNSHGGVLISNAPTNTIGTAAAGSGNLISGNQQGVFLNGAGATGNLVQGNLVGTDAAGSAAVPNASGIYFFNAPGNTIGGTDVAAGNVVSGNNAGVLAEGANATGNRVQGNRIGLNASGTAALPNNFGVVFQMGASSNTVGGAVAGARNIISRNIFAGVYILGSGTTGNLVQGNFIGVTADGTASAGNANAGVRIDAPAFANRIGGTTVAAANVISGNGQVGILIFGPTATGNRVEGNLIGTNAAGTAAVPNLVDGVQIAAPSNIIGGTAAGAGNQISGNAQHGVLIIGSDATGNLVHGNRIGTTAAGTAALPNTQDGVRIDVGASQNAIGAEAAAANTIAFNGGSGVAVVDATSINNTIRRNAIFNNGGLGIDLGGDLVTPNDAGDPDPGPNTLQNFPVVTLARNEATGTRIRGTLNSTASTQFMLDFFASPVCDGTHGEGQRYLRSGVVTTNASGDGTFNVVASPAVAVGQQITATATGPSGTSEFTLCRLVTGP
jgi:VCBS repeat protein